MGKKLIASLMPTVICFSSYNAYGCLLLSSFIHYCLCSLPLLVLYEVPSFTAVTNGIKYLRNQIHVQCSLYFKTTHGAKKMWSYGIYCRWP